ncbi:GtrA family protein [Candidatus Saccharibacteria bacterium]|nr:GtrA family protein [Candidatus Saccharibacteria bacterium]MBQ3413454.1 GtrA family protein [Candidatus Saccharibacteria bacterium]
MSDSHLSPKPPRTDVKTSRHAIRYLIVGVSVTLFNYILYAVLSNLIVRNNDLLWLSSLIATAVTTVVAYFAHSKITWKERSITKTAIYKFFIWNALLTFAISPALTQLFSLITPLYEFTFNITSALHLPFTYEFVLTTGTFVLTTAVIMILNFLFYDRFVFGNKPTPTTTHIDDTDGTTK